MTINIHGLCTSASCFYTYCRQTVFTPNVYACGMNSQQIGERLRAHRTRAPKVSLAKLAAETRSMTASGISNYEQGIRLLKAREASVLADAFKRLGKPISASELLGIEEKKGQHESGKGLGALTRH